MNELNNQTSNGEPPQENQIRMTEDKNIKTAGVVVMALAVIMVALVGLAKVKQVGPFATSKPENKVADHNDNESQVANVASATKDQASTDNNHEIDEEEPVGRDLADIGRDGNPPPLGNLPELNIPEGMKPEITHFPFEENSSEADKSDGGDDSTETTSTEQSEENEDSSKTDAAPMGPTRGDLTPFDDTEESLAALERWKNDPKVTFRSLQKENMLWPRSIMDAGLANSLDDISSDALDMCWDFLVPYWDEEIKRLIVPYSDRGDLHIIAQRQLKENPDRPTIADGRFGYILYKSEVDESLTEENPYRLDGEGVDWPKAVLFEGRIIAIQVHLKHAPGAPAKPPALWEYNFIKPLED